MSAFEPSSAHLVITIIHPDDAVRDSLGYRIGLEGFVARHYTEGRVFLEELPQRVPARLVVCEARLPDTTGVEVYRLLRDQYRSELRPTFALMIGRHQFLTAANARRLGIEHVLYKPVRDIEPLLRTVQQRVAQTASR